jgi:hypothetical protein
LAEQSPTLRPVLISRGRANGVSDVTASYGLEMLIDENNDLRHMYDVRGTPAAVLIDHQGRIAAPTALGPKAIRELIGNLPFLSSPALGREANGELTAARM